MHKDSLNQYQLSFVTSIKELDPLIWNSLIGCDYPFLRHEFLLALEESQCTTAESGWQPFHATISIVNDDLSQTMIGFMPLYIKTNSTGEYIFDWSWADAYQQNGIQYYPKFVSSIPFTPSTGPRICISPEHNYAQLVSLLATNIPIQAKELNISSWHLLFPEAKLSKQLQQQGIQQRLGCQYQWFNNEFNNFDDFLNKFSSRKRKNIKKERNKITANEITFKLIEGADINQEQWQHFYQFYQSTYFVRGRQPYLSENFFLQLGVSMPENLLLVLAVKDNKYIAGALCFKSSDTLYGRYWGCIEEYKFLHFETCYYQGIDYCIKHNIKRFDSGAQGEHKIQRGFEPILTYSNHWISHPQFNKAIANFLTDEENYILDYIERTREFLPFKKEQ